jgi:hypothetical protein
MKPYVRNVNGKRVINHDFTITYLPNATFDELVDLLLHIADNLNDMPISDDWADSTAKRIEKLLGE